LCSYLLFLGGKIMGSTLEIREKQLEILDVLY